MKDTLAKNGLMLGTFAVITTALIAMTFFTTEPRIEQQKARKLLSVLNEVVPHKLHDNAMYADCTEVVSKQLGNTLPHRVYRATLNGAPSALVLEATAPDGYSGDIELVIGVDTQLKVQGVRVLEHKETPGLGDKIELSVSNWITQFTGKRFNADALAPWQVKKDGGEFDQFTGATITPRAVVSAVKNALLFAAEEQSKLFSAPNACLTTAPTSEVSS